MFIYIQGIVSESLSESWGRGERYRPAPLTQDINMAVLNIADALFDGLVTAHVQWKQRQGLAICISCRLH